MIFGASATNRECKICNEVKPLTDGFFPPQRSGSNKLGYKCRKCASKSAGIYKRANRDKYRKGNAARDRTHCPVGHLLAEGNLRARRTGHRECLTCHRERERRRKKLTGVGSRRTGFCKRGHELSLHRRPNGNGCVICHRVDEMERGRAKGSRPRWMCIRGHDMREVGQYGTGRCRECVKAKSRAHRWKDATTASYVKVLRNDPCSYCGNINAPCEIDHIHPRSKGGIDHWSNLTAACETCNYEKRAKPLLKFLCEAV